MFFQSFFTLLLCHCPVWWSGGAHTSPIVLSLPWARGVVAVVDLTPQGLLLLLEVSNLAVQVGHHLVVVLVVPLVGGIAVARARACSGEHVVEELSERDTEDGAGCQRSQEPNDGAGDQIESEVLPCVEDPGRPV